MKLRVLGCYGGNVPELGMTSFLLNDSVCLDAGFVSGALSLREQVKVKDVIISHSHLDHTCSLPFLIDNNFSAPGFILRIYAIREVIASMKNHLFNNHTWPDFTCLPNDLTPVLKLVEIPEERPFKVNGLSVRAIRVSHIGADDRFRGRGPAAARSPTRATPRPRSASGKWSTRRAT